MSSSAPPPAGGYGPPAPQGGSGAGQPPPGGYGQPPAPPPSSAGRNRGLVLGIVGLALALILGTAAFAVYRVLSGGGEQPADALPGNAIGYFRIDLDPSAGQKVSAIRLLKKFPAFSDATGITDEDEDLRRRAFEEFKQATPECAELDYDADIASWLGDRAGFAVLPPEAGGSEPGVAVVVQVNDQTAAEDGLEALRSCAGGDPVAHAPVGEDYLLFAETEALVQQYAQSAQDNPLSENADFKADLERLGDPGIISGWLSVEALVEALPADSLPTGFDSESMMGASSMAAAVRFDEGYLEIAGVVSGADTPSDLPHNQVVDLPETTFVAASVSGAGGQVDNLWQSLGSLAAESGESIDVLADQIEQETGLVLPADLATVLGDNVTLAMDARDLDFQQLAESGDVSMLRLGARFQTNVAAFHTVLDKIEQYAVSQGGELPLTTVDGDGFVALSTNADYADELSTAGGLGESEAFTSAVPDADSAVALVYANFDAVEAQVIQLLQDAGAPPEVIDNLRPFASIGAVSHIPEEGVVDFSLRITVN